VAVKSAFAIGRRRPVDVRADLADDRVAEGDVGDEVAVHDVDVAAWYDVSVVWFYRWFRGFPALQGKERSGTRSSGGILGCLHVKNVFMFAVESVVMLDSKSPGCV